MILDIRIPIGLLFALVGLILVAVGAFGPANQTDVSLGININLIWGCVLLAFAALMLLLAFWKKKPSASAQPDKEAASHLQGR